MRRILALVRKDLVEHGVSLLLLAAFVALAWGLLALVVLAGPATVTYVEVHATMLRFFVVLAGLALGNRLVVAEYHGRTQRFLEALPIGRFDVILVKLGLGIVLLEALALGSLGATLVLASTREPIDALFVGVLAARTAAFALFLVCFFFAMGMLGRLRVPLYVGMAIALAIVADATELELSRFGPIALVGTDLAVERSELPVEPLLVTLGLAAGWAGLAVLLASVREGSVAEALAKRMTMREGVTLGVVLLAVLLTWARLDPPNEPAPYRFPDEGVVRAEGGLPIEVQFFEGDEARADAEALCSRLSRELPPLRDAMGWERLPTVRVTLAERLDGRTFESLKVREEDGVLVRANYRRGPEWDEDAFVSEVVGLTLDAATGGRARWEPIEWPRDGLAAWWPHRDADLPEVVVLRALWATRERGVDAARLRWWDRTLEREGERVAGALAATGIATLDALRGREAVFALGRALFGRRLPDDFRAVLHGLRHPLPATLREEAEIEQAELIAAWTERIRAARAREDLRAALGALPHGAATIAVEARDGMPTIVARVTLDRPPPAGATISLAHHDIGPFDDFVWPWEPRREERAWPESERTLELVLAGRYGPGSRVWVALDLEGTALGAPARLAQARVEVP